MKRSFVLTAFLLLFGGGLSGCASLGKEFDNKFTCTPDGQAFVVSMYGPLGIASKIAGTGLCAQGVSK